MILNRFLYIPTSTTKELKTEQRLSTIANPEFLWPHTYQEGQIPIEYEFLATYQEGQIPLSN